MHPLSPKVISLDAYRNGRWLVFDFETTNNDKGSAMHPDNRVVMVAWKSRRGVVKHHYGNILECKEFWEAVEAADYLIAHNAKFEALWLHRMGYDPTNKLWADTMIAEKVRLGNRFGLINLGDTSERYGHEGKEEIIDDLMKAGVCPSQMPQERLIARCRRDVRTTELIWKKQLKGADASGRLGVLLTRCLLTPILAEMETAGICLDKERVCKTYDEYKVKLAELQAKLDEFTGGINLNSDDQMAHFLYGGGLVEEKYKEEIGTYKNGNTKYKAKVRMVKNKGKSLRFREPTGAKGKPKRNKPSKQWPEGKPKTDKDTLEWLMGQARTEKQREFVRQRRLFTKVDSALSKNLKYFKGVVEEREGGICYARFNQCNTQTHRLSSSGIPQEFNLFPGKEPSVQFQNMPRIFKPLLKSRDPDYYLVEADGSQLEFRVAAFLGQDTQAMRDIQDPDFDAHVTSAAVMNELVYSYMLAKYREGDKEMKGLRQDAKPDTFKPLYGGTKGTEAQERWYKEFQDRYWELYAVQEGWVSEVMGNSKGMLVLPWGMRFYWDYYVNYNGVAMDKRKHKSITPSVFNYPVQSLATAEIIPVAMVYLYYRCKKLGLRVRFINTVHDSVIAEVHKDDMEQYKKEVVKAFTDDVYQYLWRVYGMKFNVPLGCEIVWGTHWSEGEEMSVDVEPPTEWEKAA